MERIRAESWNDLNEHLYSGSWKEPLERFRSSYAFCGMPVVTFDLQTSIVRLGSRIDFLEGHVLRNFRKYASLEAVPGDSIWNWLAVAQHHGLPTRLLDRLFSPFVAL